MTEMVWGFTLGVWLLLGFMGLFMFILLFDDFMNKTFHPIDDGMFVAYMMLFIIALGPLAIVMTSLLKIGVLTMKIFRRRVIRESSRK